MKENKVFECKMCGECCRGEGGIIVTKSEIERISNYLNISQKEFIEHYLTRTPSGKYSIKMSKEGYCIFFNKNKGCIIHKVKPNICRAWPFFKGNLEDVLSFNMAKTYCPGIHRDVSYRDFVEYGHKYLKENLLITEEKLGPNALKINGV